MVKKLLQDVLPPGKKTIRHIPLPRDRASERREEIEKPRIKESTPKKSRFGSSRKRFFKLFIILLAFAVAAGAIIYSSWLLSSAEVTVVPKHEKAAIDIVLESRRDDQSAPLSNQLVTATSTLTETVTATAEKPVAIKASGKVVIYNNFSSASQRLIKNTRLQSADGRIYRIDQSVMIPGNTTVNGKTVPGSLTVTVYAEAAGQAYNLKLSDLKGDFTIPGFKDTPRFSAFYGRQQTDITGGFSGLAKVVDDSVLTATENDLKTKLRDALWKSATESLPPNMILFPNAFFVDYGDFVETGRNGDSIEYDMSAVYHGVIFDKEALTKAMANKVLKDFDNGPVLLETYDNLKFVPKSAGTGNVWQNNPFVFNVSGGINFVWQFDSSKLSADLASKQKNATSTWGVLRDNYKGIMRAEAVIKPFWMQSFPKDPTKIRVIVKLD